jgi:hypothetical protein
LREARGLVGQAQRSLASKAPAAAERLEQRIIASEVDKRGILLILMLLSLSLGVKP